MQIGQHFLEEAKYPSLDQKTRVFTKMFTNFHVKDILFGQFCSDNDDSIQVNYIILESKFISFRSNLSKSFLSPSLKLTRGKNSRTNSNAVLQKQSKKQFPLSQYTKWNSLLPLMELKLSPQLFQLM